MKPIDRSELAQVMTPVATARGLPNAYYLDAGIFEVEKRRIFAEGWALIGFGKDVAEPGMAKPISFLGVPLVSVRDRDGTLRRSVPGDGKVSIRISGHYGIVQQSRSGLHGQASALPEWIDPITQPGAIFVTGDFATALFARVREGFRTEYAGEHLPMRGSRPVALYALMEG